MEKEQFRVVLSKSKKTSHAFMVALIPALPIPKGLKALGTITDCAIIAANDENGNEIYSYVHLESDEKQFIGDALVNACAPMNEWFWCELFGHPVDHV